MIAQLFRKRYQSSKALGVGLIVGVIHSVIFELVEFNVPITFYATMFLIAFGWFWILDWLDLKLSAVFSSFLVAFQMVMVFNTVDGNVVESVLYGIYPYIITIINILMIGSGLGERDDMATNRTNANSLFPRPIKSKGAHK